VTYAQRRSPGVLDCLPDRERQVIALRFGLDDGEPKTLEQISRRVGLTRERVRQIQEQSLRRLASSARG
jgi:RNA polymerase primary sigma factor